MLLPAGVGWAALETPGGLVSVFTTHLSANYGQQWQAGARGLPPATCLPRDALAGVRLLQMLELAAFVGGRSRGSVGTVLAGDLNAAPDTLEMLLLRVSGQRAAQAERAVTASKSGVPWVPSLP
jgi:endonuclease/exonuclease/phosphatase family metal-dependent hydrolase